MIDVKSRAERMMPGVFKPPHDYNIGGWRQTGDIRICNGWFGAVLEEMWDNQQGIRSWEKMLGSFVLKRGEL